MNKKVEKIIRFSVMVVVVLRFFSCTPSSEKKMNVAKKVTKATMKAVVPGMVKTLSARVNDVGVAASVEYCQSFAPAYGKEKRNELSALFAKQYNIESVAFKRVSLKLRNPKNKPTAQEAEILKKWQEVLSSGKEIQPAFFVKDDVYVGMMPMRLPSEKCLSCHGENLKLDVEARIKKLYPEDQAVGYQKKGDLRGSFVVYTKI